MSDKKLIAGIGSALIDILTYQNDEFVIATGSAKGGMTLVDNPFIDDLLGKISGERHVVPGGSACNTIVGVGMLGGPARFVGKSGRDAFADIYQDDLTRNHVEPVLFKSDSPTGRVMSIITPDAQRTMFTYLGASAETEPSEVTSEVFKDAAIVHIEGYLLFNRDLIEAAFKAAHEAGAKISLDLASFTVVEGAQEYLDKFVKEYVDILIANEDEARTYTGLKSETEALEVLSEKTEIAVVNVGKRGSFIARGGRIINVEALAGEKILDTTGAGDLWASGFLYGLVNDYPIDKCGELASACGYEVCRVVGTRIPAEGWDRIARFKL
jgi:sugar/nucleoside kinase (ribokinase family)